MDETSYHILADAALADWYDRLDAAFEAGSLEDLELTGGVLSIHTASGKTYILSKHTASRQLWLASPVSGGLHFAFNTDWRTADGKILSTLLRDELAAENIEVAA